MLRYSLYHILNRTTCQFQYRLGVFGQCLADRTINFSYPTFQNELLSKLVSHLAVPPAAAVAFVPVDVFRCDERAPVELRVSSGLQQPVAGYLRADGQQDDVRMSTLCLLRLHGGRGCGGAGPAARALCQQARRFAHVAGHQSWRARAVAPAFGQHGAVRPLTGLVQSSGAGSLCQHPSTSARSELFAVSTA